jgi:hypothetical protein
MSSLVVEISDKEDDDFCIKANCPSCGNTCQDYGENSDSFIEYEDYTEYPLLGCGECATYCLFDIYPKYSYDDLDSYIKTHCEKISETKYRVPLLRFIGVKDSSLGEYIATEQISVEDMFDFMNTREKSRLKTVITKKYRKGIHTDHYTQYYDNKEWFNVPYIPLECSYTINRKMTGICVPFCFDFARDMYFKCIDSCDKIVHTVIWRDCDLFL